MFMPLPFASKELPDGRKLYRRKYGYRTICPANTNTEIVMTCPYNVAKINLLEIIDLPETLKIDLVVRLPDDTQVDKFGFDVEAVKDFYSDKSEYDAELYLGMKVVAIIKNGSTEFTAKANIVWHEVK